MELPTAKRQKIHNPPRSTFRKDQPLPSAEERRRLESLDQDSDAWLAERTKRMGASSVSCAVGLGPATPMDYWRLKTGRIEREDTEMGQWIMDRGHRVEPEAAAQYERLFGVKLRSVGIYVHPTIPWIHASPDRLVYGNDKGIVELKCPVYTLPARKKPICDQYMCQVQQQMQCVGPHVEWCDLCFYYRDDMGTGNTSGVRIWRIWRSDAYWQRMLESMEIMATCLEHDIEPILIYLRPKMPSVRYQLIRDWEEPMPPEAHRVDAQLNVAVIGSRGFRDYAMLKKELDNLGNISRIVSGGAQGADALGARYAREKGVELVEHKANWAKYGKRAGVLRNRLIVSDADEVIAFWDGHSAGTRSSISMARAAKKPVHIHLFNQT